MSTKLKRSQTPYEVAVKQGAAASEVVSIPAKLLRRPNGIKGPRGCIPIWWCLCVQDSPNDPCPCDAGPVIWVPEPYIVAKRTPADGSGHADDVVDLVVSASAPLVIEITEKVTPKSSGKLRVLRSGAGGALERADEDLWVQEYGRITAGRLSAALDFIEKSPEISVGAKKINLTKVKNQLVAAFMIGWAIGEFIDEQTGASDALSEWLFDHLGPWDELF